MKLKTWVQIQYNPIDEETKEDISEELKETPLEKLESQEQKVEEIKTEIIGNFQQATILAIGSGQTVLGLEVGDVVLFKHGSGEDFQWIKDSRLLQKHQIIAKIS